MNSDWYFIFEMLQNRDGFEITQTISKKIEKRLAIIINNIIDTYFGVLVFDIWLGIVN